MSTILSASNGLLGSQDSLFFEGNEIRSFEYEKALGGNIFLGYGKLNGNISNFISDPYFVGINIDIYRKRILIQFDDCIGFGKVSQAMLFQNGIEWSKDEKVLHAMAGGNIGYKLINTESLMLVPLAGLGFNSLSHRSPDSSLADEVQPFLFYYKFGSYLDIKAIRIFPNNGSFNDAESYSCLRLSLGLSAPLVNPKYDAYYRGSMFYLTIGMGGLVRR